MILLPTKYRPDSLRRYIRLYHDLKVKEPHVVILEDGDTSYSGISLPPGWIFRRYSGGNGACSHYNKVFAEFPNEPFYGFMADDVVPETQEWDSILKNACMPDKVAYGWEGIDRTATHGARLFPAHCFVGGELARKWGFLVPPGINHFYADNWWFDGGEQVPLDRVRMTHFHFKNGLAQKDRTYQERPNSAIEEEIYLNFARANAHLLYRGEITLHRRKVKP